MSELDTATQADPFVTPAPPPTDTAVVPPAAAVPAPPPVFCKLWVCYVYTVKGSKKERHGRTFISNVHDLVAQAHIENAERVIAQSIGPEVDGVCLLNWKALVV